MERSKSPPRRFPRWGNVSGLHGPTLLNARVWVVTPTATQRLTGTIIGENAKGIFLSLDWNDEEIFLPWASVEQITVQPEETVANNG